MNRSNWFLALILMVSGCLGDTETELDRTVERDNKILEEFISTNGIEATKSQAGYYFRKETSIEDAPQIVNKDILGIYYEIKTIDGHLVHAHTDETKEPLIFRQSQDGIWPIVISYAAGLAREGEEFTIYSPSYLAFGNYSYEQLILPNSNLVMKIKYAKRYTEEELVQREDEIIQQYIEDNNWEGFEKKDHGVYVRVVEKGDDSTSVSQNGSHVTIDFELFELGESVAAFKSTAASRPNISVGREDNLRFLNVGLLDLHEDAKVEIIAPSFAAYKESIQIVPAEIRADLYDKGENIDLVRPFTPIRFNAEILSIQ